MGTRYDVIVVGGGHAGVEAALAAARMGNKILLLTHNIETIGQMSCNPAIGGVGKGHLVKEIDALGGGMARAADKAAIHLKVLNSSKGPAVRATRAQADRTLYKAAISQLVGVQENLSIFQQAVDNLLLEGDHVVGVITQMGIRFTAPAVILTVGTFLSGKIYIGQAQQPGGRAGDAPAIPLAMQLRELFPHVRRLKTGTPPRLDGRSINFTALEVQYGDNPRPIFSFIGSTTEHPKQIPCHITRTNPKTHRIIVEALDRSPIYSSQIEGIGPRYCPSIEDKVVRFSDKESHQIFVEPEGLQTKEVYPNGISTSLPYDVQVALVGSIQGFEDAHITRPGYAIEYDFFDPRKLRASLETRQIRGLFFAGQINGTTGYEEAAAQGLLAGVNAARYATGETPWEPGRHEAYLGVMIDDLITRGTREPYRMFTSRAEYRLQLREDNADLRLTPIGRKLGLIDDNRWRMFEHRRDAIEKEKSRCEAFLVKPDTNLARRWLDSFGQFPTESVYITELLRRPEITLNHLCRIGIYQPATEDASIWEQVEIETKYAGYIHRQEMEIGRRKRQEYLPISDDINFGNVPGLSTEVRQVLEKYRPQSLGQASRIAGVTPVAISLLLVYLRKYGRLPRST